MTRKPDYVFNVWSSGRTKEAGISARLPANWHLVCNEKDAKIGKPRLTHRIRVYMKAKA